MCSVVQQGHLLPDVKVKSTYLHGTRRELPDKVMEGDSVWFLQGVCTCLFRRQPSGQEPSDQSIHGPVVTYTIRAVMLKENVDLLAGDFNRAAWRRENSNIFSIIENAFADCALPMPPGPTPLWRPGSILWQLG